MVESSAAEFRRIRAREATGLYRVEAVLVMPPADAGGRRAVKVLYTICCQPGAVARVVCLAMKCGPPHQRGCDKDILDLALNTCNALCRCSPVSQRGWVPTLQAGGKLEPHGPPSAKGRSVLQRKAAKLTTVAAAVIATPTAPVNVEEPVAEAPGAAVGASEGLPVAMTEAITQEPAIIVQASNVRLLSRRVRGVAQVISQDSVIIVPASNVRLLSRRMRGVAQAISQRPVINVRASNVRLLSRHICAMTEAITQEPSIIVPASNVRLLSRRVRGVAQAISQDSVIIVRASNVRLLSRHVCVMAEAEAQRVGNKVFASGPFAWCLRYPLFYLAAASFVYVALNWACEELVRGKL
jgi:hypothetical protein